MLNERYLLATLNLINQNEYLLEEAHNQREKETDRLFY